MRRIQFFLIFGLTGLGLLIALGSWQVQRLAWKEDVIAQIEARILADPVEIPQTPDPQRDAYLPVKATGILGQEMLRVLVSQKEIGAGYRVITALETDAGRVLVDHGFIPADQPIPTPHDRPITILGNLQWPSETDSFTPDPDIAGNIWFARDVDAMAAQLQTRPVLVVARAVSFQDSPVSPMPVNTQRIPNNHLQYAITWFSLAFIWAAMTAYFLWRTRAQKTS